MSGTAAYEGSITRTHEKLANALGVVHAPIQFLLHPYVVNSDLTEREIGQHQVWHKGKSANFRGHARIVLSSFPCNGVPASHCGRAPASGQGVALGRRS